jgi:hypothetical protein
MEDLKREVAELRKAVADCQAMLQEVLRKQDLPPTSVNYNVALELAIFNYWCYLFLDKITGKQL